MAGWLSKVVKRNAESPADEPQPFEHRCHCGTVRTGLRETTFLSLRCTSCQRHFFILPRNPYLSLGLTHVPPFQPKSPPTPPVEEPDDFERRLEEARAVEDPPPSRASGPQRPPKTPPSTPGRRSPTAEDIPTRDERSNKKKLRKSSSPPPRPGSLAEWLDVGQNWLRQLGRRFRTGSTESEAVAKPARQKSPPLSETDRVLLGQISLENRRRGWLRRWLKPVRLVILAALLLVCCASYFVVHSRQQAAARRELTEAVELAERAMNERDFLTAEREYKRAVDALTLLRRDDVEARQIRQQWHESSAMTSLLSVPLNEVVDWLEVTRKIEQADAPVSLASHFPGRWLIVEGTVFHEFGFDPIADANLSPDSGEPAPATPPASGKNRRVPRYRIDLTRSPAGRNVVVGFTLPEPNRPRSPKEFQEATEAAEALLIGRRRWIALRLDSARYVRRDEAANREETILVDASEAFLWSGQRNLQGLGLLPDDSGELPVEEDFRESLEQQSKYLGVVP